MQKFNNEVEQKFSLRKYTIGLCSVCLGFVTIGMGSQTVKADTVNNVEKSSVMQENNMQDADSATAKPNITPTETKKNEVGSVATTAPKTNTTSNGVKANTADSANSTKTKPTKANSTVANSNNVSAQAQSTKAESVVQPKVSATSTEAKLNEPGSAVVKPNVTSKEAKPNIADSATSTEIKPQETRLAKTVNTKVLAESKVATDNQFDFDDWTTQIDDSCLNITGYKGDRSKQIVVPNGADFAKAGKNDQNLQVEIDKNTLADLIVDGVAPKLSNTNGQKIVAKGNDWSDAFSGKNLHDISGLANLDTSNVTNMNNMFYGNKISNLSSLANWNIGNVTSMSNMFDLNQIIDLSPLAKWNTSNVTNMYGVFNNNWINDVSGLATWDISNVTNMDAMLNNNHISDLSPFKALADNKTENQATGDFRKDGLPTNEEMTKSNQLVANSNVDYTHSVDGKPETVTLSDSSTLTFSKDVIHSDDGKENDIEVTFKSNSFKAGDVYQFKFANWFLPLKQGSLENLPSALGTTTSTLDDSNIRTITDTFTSTGSITQKFHVSAANFEDLRRDGHEVDYLISKLLIAVTKNNQPDQSGAIYLQRGKVGNGSIRNPQDAINLRNGTYIDGEKYHVTYRPIVYLWNANLKDKQTDFDLSLPDEFQVEPSSFQLTDKTGTPITDSKILSAFKWQSLGNNTYRLSFSNLPDNDVINQINYGGYKVAFDATLHANGKTTLTDKNGNGISVQLHEHQYNTKEPVYDSPVYKVLDPLKVATKASANPLIYWTPIYKNIPQSTKKYPSTGFSNNQNGNLIGGHVFNYDVMTNLTNAKLTLNIPDGFNLYSFDSQEKGKVKSMDVIFADGTRTTVQNSASFAGDNNKAIRQIVYYFNNIDSSGLYSPSSDDLTFLKADKFELATNYANGNLVEPKDKLTISGNLSSDQFVNSATMNFDVITVDDPVNHTIKESAGAWAGPNQTSSAPNQEGGDIGITFAPWDNTCVKLDNPVFYIQYNNLMSPELDKISVSNPNGGKAEYKAELLDNHMIKVSVTGEYYYESHGSFEFHLPFMNTTDATSSDKPVTIYIYDGKNGTRGDKVNYGTAHASSKVIDGIHMDLEGTGTWKINVASGFTVDPGSITNTTASPVKDGKQDVHRDHADQFDLTYSLVNSKSTEKNNLVDVVNLPGTWDGKSGFNVALDAQPYLIDVSTGERIDPSKYTIEYSNDRSQNKFTDSFSNDVQAIRIRYGLTMPVTASWRLVVPVKDDHVYDHEGKTLHLSDLLYGADENKDSGDFTQENGYYVPKNTAIKLYLITADSSASATVTVGGISHIKTYVHYQDANGTDHLVELPDQAKTFNEGVDTISRDKFITSLSDADKALLPAQMVLDYNNPTVKLADNKFLDGYTTGDFKLGDKATYYTDGMQVIFEGKLPINVTNEHKVTITVHKKQEKLENNQVVTVDLPDQTFDKTLTISGQKNPFTGDVKWDSDNTTGTIHIDIPDIDGYSKNEASRDVNIDMNSKDSVINVLYKLPRHTITYIYLAPDGKGSTYRYGSPVVVTGVPNQSLDAHLTAPDGYVFADPQQAMAKSVIGKDDQTIFIDLKHGTENVSRKDDVNMTVHYVMDDGSDAPSDNKQTLSFTENGIQDLVTQKITWTPADSKTFKDVDSPVLTGYTPDQDKVAGQTVKFGDNDVEATVHYTANAQTATITYIDDTEKKTLGSDAQNGKFNQVIAFEHDPAEVIKGLEEKGYALVSNDFNSNKYQADNSNNVFYVHLKHGTSESSRKDDVNMTVHYVMDDGSKAPSDSKQTVSFTESGIKDNVTGNITWTPAESQTLKDVDSPVLTGYTADIKTAKGKVVNFDDPDINVTVHYSANEQTATITYIDDTTKTNLDSKDAKGKFGQAITFEHDPAAKIASYEKQGYVLVSNSFDNNKYQADDNNNVFYVHLKHGTKKVSRNDDVTMTVHYVMDDGSQAPNDNKQTVNFTENGIQDNVTGNITWTPAESQTLKDVDSPVLTGYTADIKTAKGKVVNFDDPDINVTVHYSANEQTAKITYIDDTTKTNLDSKDAKGKFGQAITFETAPTDKIANYEKQGYVLVSNSFDNNKYQADDNNNVFYVHLKHGTKKVSRNDDVTMTVHYVMDDGSQAPNDNKQTVSFTENGIQDNVTGNITWTPAESQTLKDVDSPVLTGYTADIKTAKGKVVNFDDPDINVTVRYSANEQTAKITYIDDTTKTNLDSKDAKGKFGQAITFETAPTDKIASYEKQGYVLVSNSFDNNKYQADDNNNVFYVHLKHKIENVTRNDTVTRTIHYLYDNGNTAQPDKTQTVSFNETGTKDDVTGKTTWDNDNAQTVDSVNTPSIVGYTPDKSSIEKQTFKFGDKDVEVTVRYSANEQTATITYIDDTTKTNLDSKDAKGKFGQAITFEHDPAAKIASYEKQGYVLVSNSFDNNKYQADDNNNVFYVHLKHGTKKVSRNDDVTMTVHYVMDDGSQAPNDNKQTVNFTENGIQDLVTQKITWTSTDSQTLNDVNSPVLAGYTADIKTVNGKSVNFGDSDINVIVTYHANAQTAKITYIDDTTKNNLDSKDASGKFGQAITFTTAPTDEIANYEKQGYKLVSNDFDNNKYQADDNKNVFYVHFVHDTKKVSQEHSASFTVHYIYKDGSQAKPDHEQTLSFTENGIQDLVTQKITWTPANSQKFDDVATPVITGYTPDQDKVIGQTANFETDNRKVTVTYSPNVQIGHINYIDDNTGKTLTRDDFSGRTNEHEDYTSIDRIQEFENKGYVFVSSDYPDGGFNFDDNDQQDQIFNVHLKHGIVTVTTKKPQTPNMPIDPDPQSPKYPKDINNTNKDVKRTIDYKFKDGKTAQPTVNDSLHFERTVVIDKVTGDVVSDIWTPSQDFNDIQTPAIQGYTSDRAVVSDKNIGHDHQDIVEHVVYSPDVQHMTITYIDDTTGETLHTDNPNGVSDQDANYTTGNIIKQFEEKHYKLVSDSTKGQDLIFDHDDNANQIYEVHFVHNTHAINQTTSPKQTIHYVYADGLASQGKVTDDNVQQLSFKRDGYNDEVTGIDHWNAWTPANGNYNAVDSPVIQGYTPDKLSVDGSTVDPTDKDIEITVTYNADKQVAHVIYFDKTANTTLDSKDLSGKSDKDSEYSTAAKIGKYKSQHYVLFEDETNGENVIFDHNDKQDQTYYVYLVHDTQKVSREHSASFTVHYIYKDGRQAKPDHEQALSFTENGIQDLVTQKITWTPADSQKFDDVVTPVITGYTPDQDKVAGQTANFETGDRKVTVTYLPDVQLGHINYIDDNTGKTLTRDNFSGRTNEHEDYTPIDRIQEFENKGYELVSNDYPDGGFNFDNNDRQDQVFNVHLKHGIVTVTSKKPQTPNMPIDPDPHSPKYPNDISNTNSDVKRTIDYKFKDGKTAQPTVNDSLHFERTVVIDKVTGDVLSDTWTPSQDFNDVQTPVIQGYTPDKTVASDKNIGHDHQNIVEHVVYSPDAQHMTITYVDDTTGKTLKQDKLDGTSDQDAKYTTGDIIKQYIDSHYKMVSDSTNGKDLIFDHDDKADQTYEVHFIHGTHTINQTTSPKQTVHYVYADGLVRQGKASDDNVQQLSFKRDGYNDEVTGTDHWNAWTPANSNYNAVDSPVIQGYTPDKSVVEKSTVNPTDKDTEITVVYYADKQTAHVIYIDKTTNDVLTSDDLSGKSDKDSGYNTEDTIGKYESRHYVLTKDETDGKNVIFDHDDKQNQTYYVYFVHGTQKVNRQDTVTSTIDYKFEDGKTAQPTVTQTKHFSEDGVKDLVTGKITWDEAESQKFDDIATKSIVGYTPDKDNVAGSTVRFGDKDIEVTVTYHNNAQTAKITYIDDTTKNNLDSKDASGKFGQAITFATAPTDEIANYKKQGYTLVSNDFNDNKYQADKSKNVFHVHFVHGTKKVSRDHSASFTVHYIYKDGRQAKPDHEQALSFTENGIQDLVTQKITWTPADSQKFDDVVTPVITGYTPDQDKVAGQTANFETGDRKVTVTYLPDVQLGHINYIDDNTGKTLTRDNFSGRTNEHEDYTPIDRIQEFENKGYELVSNDYPDGGFNFDDNDQQDQVFNVHLKHGTTTVTPDNPGHPGEPVDPKNPEGPKYPNGTELDQVKRTGTQTIHYVGAGDKTPADNKQTFIFTREITFDNVTGKIISKTPWNVQSYTFGKVNTPVIPGYHADKAVAGGETVTPDDLNKVITVTYAPDGGSGDNPGSNGGGDQGTTPTPEPVPEPTPSPDDQPDTTLPSDNNTDKDVEKDKQDKPEKVKKARKIIKTRITKQEHIGNAEKAEPIAEQEHNDQTVVSPVKNEANEPQLPQTGEANTSVIGLLGMLVAGFAEILGFESSRSRKHKN